MSAEKFKRPKAEKMLASCPSCRSVKMLLLGGRVWWQKSIVEFTNLPSEPCPACVQKSGDKGINQSAI